MSEKTIEERLMETNLQLLKEKEDLKDKVEKLENFVELVEGAIGCTDGDDIRTHIEPELAALKQ